VQCGNICPDNCAYGDCCCRQPTGRICIHKVDVTDHSISLPCAEFALQDSNCVPCAMGCTDENGFLCFNGLRNGTYHLCEINPPCGYQRNEDVTTITLTPFENQVFLQIENTPCKTAKGSVTVMARVIDNGVTPLPGITIALFNASRGPVATAVTDGMGTARFTDIPFGTYSVDVLKPPLGLVVPGPVQVTLSADAPDPVIALDFTQLVSPTMRR